MVKGDENCAEPLAFVIDLCFYFIEINYFDWFHNFMLQCAFLKTKMLHPSPPNTHTPKDNRCYTTPSPPHNGHPSTTTNFLCPKDTSVQNGDRFNRKCKTHIRPIEEPIETSPFMSPTMRHKRLYQRGNIKASKNKFL